MADGKIHYCQEVKYNMDTDDYELYRNLAIFEKDISWVDEFMSQKPQETYTVELAEITTRFGKKYIVKNIPGRFYGQYGVKKPDVDFCPSKLKPHLR